MAIAVTHSLAIPKLLGIPATVFRALLQSGSMPTFASSVQDVHLWSGDFAHVNFLPVVITLYPTLTPRVLPASRFVVSTRLAVKPFAQSASPSLFPLSLASFHRLAPHIHLGLDTIIQLVLSLFPPPFLPLLHCFLQTNYTI